MNAQLGLQGTNLHPRNVLLNDKNNNKKMLLNVKKMHFSFMFFLYFRAKL